MDAVDLSIIIVNWNSMEYLRKCISSILAMTDGMEFEIVVIDNASFDGCEKMLHLFYPQVQFIQADRNLGFAKANNLAFGASRGDCVLFLNPDTVLTGHAIETMYRYLKELPDAGAIGCKLLNTDLTLQASCIQSFPTILNQVLDSENLRHRFPYSQLWGTAPLFEETDAPAEVEAVSGACLMMNRATFVTVGMFSTDYFMYSEDVDLCLKVRNLKRKNYFIPSAVVVHHGGKSSELNEMSTFSNIMMMESRWRYFVKNRALCYGCLYRTIMLAVCLLRMIMAIIIWRIRLGAANTSRWKAAFLKWKTRLRWTVGLEGWVRNYPDLKG